MITADDLKGAGLKATVFGDGAEGMAFQVWECPAYPSLAVFWMRSISGIARANVTSSTRAT